MEDDEYWDDPFDYYEDDEDDFDLDKACVKCGDGPCYAQCDACGAPLCHMHYELGAGFCGRCDVEKLMTERYERENK